MMIYKYPGGGGRGGGYLETIPISKFEFLKFYKVRITLTRVIWIVNLQEIFILRRYLSVSYNQCLN